MWAVAPVGQRHGNGWNVARWFSIVDKNESTADDQFKHEINEIGQTFGKRKLATLCVYNKLVDHIVYQ